jgi:2-methylcitrate dehydratase PrpD
VHRPDFQAEFPIHRLAEVKITAGGRTYFSGPVVAHGDPSDPMSSAEIENKFRRYVRPYLCATEADDLLARVSRLETLTEKDMQGIIATLLAARYMAKSLR